MLLADLMCYLKRSIEREVKHSHVGEYALTHVHSSEKAYLCNTVLFGFIS